MRRFSQNRMVVAVCMLCLTSCAHQPSPDSDADLPGFIAGWWHGATALFALVASIFTDVRIYQFPNAGFSYDLGFMVAVMGWVVLIAAGSSSK